MKTIKPLKFLLIIILPIFLSVSGCKMMMKFKYGIKQPHEETPGKLISFLRHEGFPDTNLYLFRDSATFIKSLNDKSIQKNLLSHMIFDRHGLLLDRDTTKCQWSGYYLIQKLSPDSACQTITGITLNELDSCIVLMPGSPKQEIKMGMPDFTIVILWGKFLGRYNRRLFILADAVRANTSAKIEVKYLNIDMQESWHLTRQQKLMIR